MVEEKHPVGYKAIAATGGWRPTLAWIGGLLLGLFGWLGTTHPIPGWAIILLSLPPLVLLLLAAQRLSKPQTAPGPEATAMKRMAMNVNGVYWCWLQDPAGHVHNLKPYCPNCGLEIAPRMAGYLGEHHTIFQCEACSKTLLDAPGLPGTTRDFVERLIMREQAVPQR